MEIEKVYEFTILTATYNRAHTLKRLYDSILLQEYQNFEWLVIDDGSNDDTRELIQNLIKISPFNIRYYYKDNGGKHTALNLSYKLLRSRYVIIMDSDDEIAPGALKRMHEIWRGIPEEDYHKYSEISGRCIDSKTRQLVGKPFPKDINRLSGISKKRAIEKASGEKSTCRKVDILIKYPFPVYSDTKFVSEGMVWTVIKKNYEQYCVNDVFRVYYQDQPDSLTMGRIHSTQKSLTWYYLSQFYINEHIDLILYRKKFILHFINISRCAILSNKPYSEVIKSLNKIYKKVLVTLGYPISWLWIQIFARNRMNSKDK